MVEYEHAPEALVLVLRFESGETFSRGQTASQTI